MSSPRLLLVLVASAICAGCTVTTSSSATPAPTSAAPVPVNEANAAQALQNDFVAVVKRVGPSVVQIETDQGLGSGIVFDKQGDIVTNAHVVEGATSYTVTFADGKRGSASLVGTFTPNDVAVVKAQATGESLVPAAFADSSKLEVGDIAIAIGNPLGLRSSVTEGIVSGVRTAVPEGNGVTLPSVIQTSAAINPGNSGGALVDLNGNVIGIPTLAATDPQLGGGQAPGIGFAIPSNTVKDLAQQLIQSGHVTNSHRAYLGVRISQGFGNGVVISAVTPGGPADQAGLQAGDVINALNGQPVKTADDLSQILAALKPGDKAPVVATRQDGSTTTVTVTLGEFPGS
jgi:putative serine protease PepD